MSCKKCESYINEGSFKTMSGYPQSLEDVFKLDIPDYSDVYCSGTGACITCGHKIDFSFDNLIYCKITVFCKEKK